MWIYQPEQPDSPAPAKTEINEFHFSADSAPAPEPTLPPKPSEATVAAKIEDREKPLSFPPDRARKPPVRFTQGISPYYIGLAAAGVLLRLCPETQRELLLMYGKSWLKLFSDTPLRLFSTLFLSAVLLLTLLVALGFCPYGRFCSKALLFLYGTGSGLLCVQMATQYGWKGWIFFAVLPGIYAAVLAVFSVRLSRCGAQLSLTLLHLLKKQEDPPTHRISGQMLMDQYLIFCSLQILVCGALAASAGPIVQNLF